MNPIFITGVARSGTTLLGRLIGTLNNIEYEFELLDLIQIPVLVKGGYLCEDLAAGLLHNSMHEALVERVLGRKVNLRPTDWSRFWLTKSYEDLVTRWDQLHTRQDVLRLVEEKGLRFASKFPDLTPFYSFLLRSFPDSQIITITRHGFDVVASVLSKGWMEDEGLRQQRVIVPKREVPDGRIIPWWVPGFMEEKFLGWNAATRALYRWRYLVEQGEKWQSKRILDLRYEDLVWSPWETLFKIQDFLEGSEHTTKTEETLLSIDPSRTRHAELDKSLFDPVELGLAERLMKRLGY